MFFNSIFSSQINFSLRWLNQRLIEWRTFERWVKQRKSILRPPIREMDQNDRWRSSRLWEELMRMSPDSMPARIRRWRWMRLSRLSERQARVMKTGERLRTNDRTKSKRPIPIHPWQLCVSKDRLGPQNLKTDGVHSYFSFRGNDTRSKPIFRPDASQKSSSMQQQQPPGKSSPSTEERNRIYLRSNWNWKLNRN